MKALATHQSTDLSEAQREQIGLRVALNSNLWGMQDADVWAYYRLMCMRLKLDPFSHPFDVITDSKQQTKKLYPNHLCTSQLGESQGYSYGKTVIEVESSLAELGFKIAKVSISVTAPDGRSLIGEAFIDLMSGYDGKALAGTNLVNALKKAATQARRRGTLQMAGLAIPSDVIEVATLGEIEQSDETHLIIEHPPTGEIGPGAAVIQEEPPAQPTKTWTPKQKLTGKAGQIDAMREALGWTNEQLIQAIGEEFNFKPKGDLASVLAGLKDAELATIIQLLRAEQTKARTA